MAALDPAELERRIAWLRQRYGAEAPARPDYRLLVDLAVRQGRLTRGSALHREHAARVARRRAGCLLPAALLVVSLRLVARCVV